VRTGPPGHKRKKYFTSVGHIKRGQSEEDALFKTLQSCVSKNVRFNLGWDRRRKEQCLTDCHGSERGCSGNEKRKQGKKRTTAFKQGVVREKESTSLQEKRKKEKNCRGKVEAEEEGCVGREGTARSSRRSEKFVGE